MKIAIFHNILWSKYKGGVFSELDRIAASQGVEIEFTQIAETEGERSILSGVNLAYHRYKYQLLFKGAYSAVPLWRRTFALIRCAWRTDAEITIMPGYERPEYWAMMAILLLRGKRRAVFCDSTAYDRSYSYFKALAKQVFFARCHGFFGYGLRSKEYLMMLGAPEEKIFFRCQAAALSLDYSPERALANRLQARRGPRIDPLFIYVGRLSSEKGLLTLLDAMKLLLVTAPAARLRLIGAGPLEARLRREVATLQLQEQVELSGSMEVDQLSQQYAAADALVLPSTSEPWGLVANEALSHGCPVIVSEHCGCGPELIIRGVTGYTFDTGNAAALSERMMDSLINFTDTAATAERCILHMSQYTPERAASQILRGCKIMLA